jgi:uncharacterized linocin/CFP29 family protein
MPVNAEQTTGGQIGAHASIDTMQSNGNGRTLVSGSVGQRLLAADFDINILRPCAEAAGNGLTVNGVLLEDEWVMFDRQVQQVARERLPVVTDLIARGLTMALPNAMGVMSIEWERVKSDLVDAEVTMTGLPEATKDRQEFETISMPVPIFHKEFYYNLRHLAAARRNGRSPDVSHAEVATRKIAELVEYTVFNGLVVGGSTIYGLANHPDRTTGSVTASWATATGEQIIADVLAMVEDATVDNNMDGPFTLYVSRTVGNRLDEDYKANGDLTIRQRILQLDGIQSIMATGRLSGTSVLLVQTTSDVVQIIDGIQPTMVEWESHAGFQHNFKIFAIMLPRVRANGWNQTGIAHMS